MMKTILAIESSFDETAAAILTDDLRILSSIAPSSKALHKKYGGVVPEVAARAQVEYIIPVIEQTLHEAGLTLSDIDGLAVTAGPGLIGSLLVGVETTKALSLIYNIPIIPVNHVIAHMYANFVRHEKNMTTGSVSSTNTQDIQFPAISLVASGGHTELYLLSGISSISWLGGTVDDAAGEAFDKIARLLGFGTGGGPAIEVAAQQFKPNRYPACPSLPRPMMHDDSYNFSFSGLKTAVARAWSSIDNNQDAQISFAYEVQESITDVLVEKTIFAATEHSAHSILLSGGVAANNRLREKLLTKSKDATFTLHAPALELCTDNAVMIAAYAHLAGRPLPLSEVYSQPNLSVEIRESS